MDLPESSATPPRGGFGIPVLVAALIAGLAVGALAVWVLRAPSPLPHAEPAARPQPAAGGATTVELPEAAQKNAGVEIVEARQVALPAAIDVTGTVSTDEARVTAVRPLARGVVQSVAVHLGDRVQPGQVLATVDNVELGTLVGQYATEQASVRQAQADLDVKSRARDRARELIKIEGIAQQELDLREAEVRSADAAVASARARVDQVEEQIHRFGISDPQLERLTATEAGHRTESLSTLRAPFAGIVTKYDIAQGELVDPARELFTIANLSSVWVLADVYEKDIAKIQRGAPVRVRVDAYPDRVFTGQLTYVSDTIETQTRTAKVRCVVPNGDGALKVDMFARVTIPTTDSRSAMTVPPRAVQNIDGMPVVFVRQSATRFERRAVQLGVSASDAVEVVRGLKQGERVVGAGSFYLKTAALRERIAED